MESNGSRNRLLWRPDYPVKPTERGRKRAVEEEEGREGKWGERERMGESEGGEGGERQVVRVL